MQSNANKTSVRGRLAPSPTGRLHLGNAWAFLCAWLGARSQKGDLLLRIEDIDPQRSRPEYADALQEDLLWLGLSWNGTPEFQSARHERYAEALSWLEARGLVYPCFCTRRELRELAGAPQAGVPAEPVYSGRCRALGPEEAERQKAAGRPYSLRLKFDAEARARNFARSARRGLEKPDKRSGEAEFTPAGRKAQEPSPAREGVPSEVSGAHYFEINDLCLGRVGIAPDETGGDFPLCRSDGVFAYQLAVVLDDMDAGVTQVVRGMDILGSTPRQLYLYELFGGQAPEYAHVPLLLDHEGERLAKRHAALSLAYLREAGVKPGEIIGFLAHWSGLRESAAPIHARELLRGFDFKNIRQDVPRLPENLGALFPALA